MEAVGEIYGSSFDATLRHPRVALIPLLADLLVLLFAALAFQAAVGDPLLVPASRRGAELPFSVPTALPTIGDVIAAPPGLLPVTSRGLTALALYGLLTLPFLAFAEGGFLGVLNRRFLPAPGEAPEPDTRPKEEWSLLTLRQTFLEEGRRHFLPLLGLRALVTGVTLLAVALPARHAYFRNAAFGALVIHFVLMYAPYVVVREGVGPLQAIRQSFTAVSDYLATSLVTLLFLLLTTGGVSALLAPLHRALGPLSPLAAALVYAPIGTALSLFVLKVYAGMRPAEPLASGTPHGAGHAHAEGA